MDPVTLAQAKKYTNFHKAETATVLGGDAKQIWYPPTQPSSNDIAPVPNATLADFSTLWDGLMSSFPTYITKELLQRPNKYLRYLQIYL